MGHSKDMISGGKTGILAYSMRLIFCSGRQIYYVDFWAKALLKYILRKEKQWVYYILYDYIILI